MKKLLLTILSFCMISCVANPPCEESSTGSSQNDMPTQCLDCDYNCLLPCQDSCKKDVNVSACTSNCRAQCCYGVANN